MRIALTGGIGSGKSSVSTRLSVRGAVVIDADAVVKSLQLPGRHVYAEMVRRWGSRIQTDSGDLDRQAVAQIVFHDPEERQALEAIVHPAVRTQMLAEAAKHENTDAIVVFDIPLLVESILEEGEEARLGASHIVVVDCDTETAIERLVTIRGSDPADVSARIASQATRQQRLDIADFVIDNNGSLEELDEAVDECCRWIKTLSKP